jgi:transposase
MCQGLRVAQDAHADALERLLASTPHLRDLLVAERAAFSTERAAFSTERTSLNERIAQLEKERDNLRASHERLRQELELFKRRLFIAKAERKDTKELEAEFGEKMRQLDLLASTLGIAQGEQQPRTQAASASESEPEAAASSAPKPEDLAKDGKPRGKRGSNRGKGRRDLRTLPLPEERIEIPDPHLETLVAQGLVVPHGFETTYKAGHRRGGKVRIAIARVRYKTVASDAEGKVDVINAPMPNEMLPSSLLAPSLASHVIHENIGKGLPLFRIEDALEREGIAISRSTLSRCKHLVGTSLADTVVKAMHEHALATAFCISTDATGVNIQPIYSHEKGRQPCKKGHFLVMIADRDHILFEYLEKETGRAIHGKFRGFNGYVQADAKSV